ncbi:MAG: alpha/beta hydrolase [Pseudomonadota bacterium]
MNAHWLRLGVLIDSVVCVPAWHRSLNSRFVNDYTTAVGRRARRVVDCLGRLIMSCLLRPLCLTLSFLLLSPLLVAEEHSGGVEPAWDPSSYEPYPYPYYVTDKDRYTAAPAPKNTVNRHGELEHIGDGIFGVHWFVQAKQAVWHFVTAGDPKKDVVLFVHGYPDTWYAYAKVMRLLADDYYVIAVDTLGYGQSAKGADVDVSYSAVAKDLIALLERIDVSRLHLITHDRGSVIADHLLADARFSQRVRSFLRMQQSFDQPHGLPRPPHAQMATVEFQSRPNLIEGLYSGDYVSVKLPEEEIERLAWEWGFPGTAEAAARTFRGTSFDIEREFRLRHTIPNLTMPVFIVQGDDDPGQHPEEYAYSAGLLPHGKVVIVDANHFIHAEKPELVADLARELFSQARP